MLEQIGKAAKAASYQLAVLTAAQKNRALFTIADLLSEQIDAILAVNAQDVEEAVNNGLNEAMVARLRLTPARLVVMINDVRHLCSLVDPIGQLIEGKTLDNGLRLERRRVPLGVVGVIYESRPNVTIDVATLCLKTSNAVILRGGKEARRTNAILVAILQQALEKVGLPLAAVQFIDNADRTLVNELLRLDRYIDILIPRGGVALHELCREKATIPVISGGTGMCHIFVDEEVDVDAALKIIHNAKTQRPSNSNSVETVLVHQAIVDSFLPLLAQKMGQAGVILHASPAALPHLINEQCTVLPIGAADYDQEWLSLDLNVAVVGNIDEAIAHIHQHNTQHSEAILTRSMRNAVHFVAAVDSSVVYVNASTRFTDGGQFGLGSEVAISTQKLHARGPMGLETLTTYKWVGYGDNLLRS